MATVYGGISGTVDNLTVTDTITLGSNTITATGTLTGNWDFGSGSITTTGDIRTTAFATFTPTLTSAGTVPVFSSTDAYYKQVGKLVFYTIFLDGDGGTDGSGSNNMDIAVPVAISATGYGTRTLQLGNGSVKYGGSTYRDVRVAMGSDVNKIQIIDTTDQGALQDGDFAAGDRRISITGWYEAA